MHLFAGGGGGLLADLILGHNPVCAVEWDKYACRILRERAIDGWFPDLSVFEGDVRLFDPSEYTGRIHTLHAGFPCQDISVAGAGAGLGEGTRSGLYREVLRIAGVVRPAEIYLENVSAILSRGLGTVLGDLAALGYVARWICLRASDVGANHGRDRWWLLAKQVVVDTESQRERGGKRDIHQTNGGQDGQLRQQFSGSSEQSENSTEAHVGDSEHTGQPSAKVTGSLAQGSNDSEARTQPTSEFAGPSEQQVELAYTSGDRLQRISEAGIGELSGCHNEIREAIAGGGGVSEPTGSWWEVEPDVGRVANEVASRVDRLKALGNGQVPLQAAVAYSILTELF